ncbi:MAG: hypothetical protein WED07_09765 [Candidatus Freyarchaeum deiterrae]
MKKRSLLLILVLTISLTIPIFLNQTRPVYTQPIITPTQTYQIPVSLSNTSAQVNFTVTTNIGVLIAGNVASWSLNVSATCFGLEFNNITNITINSINGGTQINSGIMLPISQAFASDLNMTNITVPFPLNNTISAFVLFPPASENVLLLSNTAGLACEISFNLSVTIGTTNGPETHYLDSATNGNPAVSLVLPNPSENPKVISYFTYGLLIMVFLLPLTLILTNWRLKIRRLKKESAEEV